MRVWGADPREANVKTAWTIRVAIGLFLAAISSIASSLPIVGIVHTAHASRYYATCTQQFPVLFQMMSMHCAHW
jgi:hypothetical protein